MQVIYCRDKRGIHGETLNVNVGGMGAAGLFDMFWGGRTLSQNDKATAPLNRLPFIWV